MCFNSKMVRLKVSDVRCWISTYIGFQFQNGSIKRKRYDPGTVAPTSFQFQNGSIKSTEVLNIKQTDLLFQFQNGSIKS